MATLYQFAEQLLVRDDRTYADIPALIQSALRRHGNFYYFPTQPIPFLVIDQTPDGIHQQIRWVHSLITELSPASLNTLRTEIVELCTFEESNRVADTLVCYDVLLSDLKSLLLL